MQAACVITSRQVPVQLCSNRPLNPVLIICIAAVEVLPREAFVRRILHLMVYGTNFVPAMNTHVCVHMLCFPTCTSTVI